MVGISPEKVGDTVRSTIVTEVDKTPPRFEGCGILADVHGHGLIVIVRGSNGAVTDVNQQTLRNGVRFSSVPLAATVRGFRGGYAIESQVERVRGR